MNLDDRSKHLRRIIAKTFRQGGRGHVPSAFSCLEILRVLYDSVLNITPTTSQAPKRDRLIFSKGHGCLALYAILADRGFISEEDLGQFCAHGSVLGGHPERNLPLGIEISSGSLGHGPSIGVGQALAARMDARESRIFVICGDGETNEGSVWEALMSAAKHKLDNYTIIVDYNRQQSWDTVENILPLEPYADKFRAFGFAVREVDGHDPAALEQTFAALPFAKGKPSSIIAHTVKGKGAPFMENNLAWHHKTKISAEEERLLSEALEGRE
jgi:transketolase